MELKNYWFALKSHVYVEFKKDRMLLYNTNTGGYLETELDRTIALISQMYEPENLGVIFLNKEIQSDADVRSFIGNILEKQMGDLTDMEKMPNKPVRLVPMLNLQKDIDKLKKREEDSILIGKDTMNYLLELNIFLNDGCPLSCAHCNAYCKQTHCCTANNTNQELSVEEVKNLLRQIQYSAIGKINILGGNIFQYKHIAELRELFESFQKILHCYFHYENYEENLLSDSLQVDLMVNFPLKETIFETVWQSINKEKTTVHFIIENERQYIKVEQLINELAIKKYSLHPFYTGKNRPFFEENVFIDKDDIFFKTLSIREIFRNKKLNSNFFGSLFVLPDQSVRANMNTQAIGNIKNDSILRLIYNELIENTAWRKVRDSQPCDDCCYQFICPAPSNYEFVIGKLNLCHVKQ